MTKGDLPTNDNTTPAYDKAKRNFEEGKSPYKTLVDLNRQKQKTSIKPVAPKDPS